MMSILFTISLCLFSAHVTECTEIQDETIHIYNYDNKFGDIFHQGNTDDFNMMKYTDIDTGYEGPHVGGVFHTEGTSMTSTNYFDGYIVDISTTQYCGHTGNIWMYIYYADGEHGDGERWSVCGTGWFYNQTWISANRDHQTALPKFRMEIHSYNVYAKSPNGIDQIKITTTTKPPPPIPTASIPAITPSNNNSKKTLETTTP